MYRLLSCRWHEIQHDYIFFLINTGFKHLLNITLCFIYILHKVLSIWNSYVFIFIVILCLSHGHSQQEWKLLNQQLFTLTEETRCQCPIRTSAIIKLAKYELNLMMFITSILKKKKKSNMWWPNSWRVVFWWCVLGAKYNSN